MILKTLKHKTLPDIFGHIIDVPSEDGQGYGFEIAHGVIPLLQPITATMELAKKYWEAVPNAKLVLEYLDEFEFVEVEVKVIEK